MATHDLTEAAAAQHYVQCQLCAGNVQFYCRPCRQRLCESCVGTHLQTQSPEAHQFIHYHKFSRQKRLMTEPEFVSSATCAYINMLDIALDEDCNFYVCSTISRHIHKYDFRNKQEIGKVLVPGWPRRIATHGNELFFTERNENNVKVFSETKGIQTLFSTGDWDAHGVACTTSGLILLGLQKLKMGKIAVYDRSGKMAKEVVSNQGRPLYSNPYYVTENTNGDLCAADIVQASVTVVDRNGVYRFSYTGNPANIDGFDPHGIAADSQSNLVIADWITRQLHLIDENGQFLRYLAFSPPSEVSESPTGVCVDVNDLLLICGYDSQTVKVVKYLQ